MKTASHFTYFGPGRIVISLGNPRGVAGGYKMFKPLAPTRDILNLPYGAYRPRFFAEVLGVLDPQQTWDKLHELAGGAEPVIQCFERPPFTASNWCHRRMVAEWFEQTLGHKVDEVEPQPKPAKVVGSTAPGLFPARGTDGPLKRIRADIEQLRVRICGVLGVPVGVPGDWMSLPVAVISNMTSDDAAEWVALQVKYREIDG